MSRLIDRCLMLAAGGLLGFAAAREVGLVSSPASAPAPAEAVTAASAAPDPGTPDAPPRGDRRRGGAREMEALVGEVVNLRPSPGGRRNGPLTEDEIDRCLVVARDIDPPLYDGLMALREADPDEFRSRLARSSRLRFLADLRQDEPHLYELKLIELRTDREVARLSEELRSAAVRGDADRVESLCPRLVAQMRMQQAFILLARKQTLDRSRERLEELERAYQEDLSTVDERIAAIVDRLARGEAASAATNTTAATPDGVGATGTAREASDAKR